MVQSSKAGQDSQVIVDTASYLKGLFLVMDNTAVSKFAAGELWMVMIVIGS